MSKYNIIDLWNEKYPKTTEVYDYAGRVMLKSACGDPKSKYHPTIDHIRPLSKGGLDLEENIVICHCETNGEKADTFATWKTNNRIFQDKRKRGNRHAYNIFEVI
ncbi:HNH endonuclease signature motif containing protein [Mycoplasmatota bacterium zrk1]